MDVDPENDPEFVTYKNAVSSQGESLEKHGQASQYERLRPSYERLVEEVQFVLKGKLAATAVRVAQIIGRAKTVESFTEKVQRKGYKNPLEEATDLAGVRVVCYYDTDVNATEEVVKASFRVHERVDKTDNLGVDKMGYHGRTFVIALGD